MLRSIILRLLVEIGACVIIATPFPDPEMGYGWLWLFGGLYFFRTIIYITNLLIGWIYFFLFGKATMVNQLLSSLQLSEIDRNIEYFDAEDYLLTIGEPLSQFLNNVKLGANDIDFNIEVLAQKIRSGLFASQVNEVLHAYKISDAFGSALMLKISLREAVKQFYRPIR
jgi:hypothetical protein